MLQSILKRLFARPASAARHRPTSFQPALEALEVREALSVTPHTGVVMPKVEAQGIYYGSQWRSSPDLFKLTGTFESFLHTTVSGTYLDALSRGGYPVGRGTSDGGTILLKNLNSTTTLDDSALRTDLQALIDNGSVKSPDGNRLYVLFVQPNVKVTA